MRNITLFIGTEQLLRYQVTDTTGTIIQNATVSAYIKTTAGEKVVDNLSLVFNPTTNYNEVTILGASIDDTVITPGSNYVTVFIVVVGGQQKIKDEIQTTFSYNN